jgi:hypothetical protein
MREASRGRPDGRLPPGPALERSSAAAVIPVPARLRPAPPARPTPVGQDVLPSLANRADPSRGAD